MAASPKGRGSSLYRKPSAIVYPRIHYYNHWLIVGLTALHVAAIAYYLLARKEDLLTPMLTGDKIGIDAPAAEDGMSIRVRAAVFAAIAIGVVAYLVTL